MIKIFTACVSDFFTKKFILLSLFPFFASLAIFISLLALLGGEVVEAAQSEILEVSFIARSDFWREIFANEITGGVLSALIYSFGAFLALMGGLVCAGIISGFFTPTVARFVNEKYYHANVSPEVSNLKVAKIYVFVCLKFALLFVLGLVLLFVPVLNIFALNIAFFYLFYQFMLTDVASVCASERRFELIMAKGGDWDFKLAALGFYVACLVPGVGLFFQLFFIMFFSHLILRKSAV